MLATEKSTVAKILRDSFSAATARAAGQTNHPASDADPVKSRR